MTELSSKGRFKKLMRVGLIGFSLASLFILPGCATAIDTIKNIKPADCAPLVEPKDWTTDIYVHSSAEDRINNIEALCKLTDALANIVGAKGKNEIIFFSNRINLDQFVRFYTSTFDVPPYEAKIAYDEMMRNQFVGRFGKVNDDVNRMIIIVDALTSHNPYHSAEFLLIQGISGELGHGKYRYNQSTKTCGEEDMLVGPTAYAIALGAADKVTGNSSYTDQKYATVACNINNFDLFLDKDVYEKALTYPEPGLYSLAEQALNSSSWPDTKP